MVTSRDKNGELIRRNKINNDLAVDDIFGAPDDDLAYDDDYIEGSFDRFGQPRTSRIPERIKKKTDTGPTLEVTWL